MKKTKISKSGPLVGIVMGSDSDWPVMAAAHETLNEYGIANEVRVISAHRTPQEMLDYAASAEARGLKIIIAGAGGAAHLPGMLASHTRLAVIGVPVNITGLKGIDAFLSIVQMPKGVPVATVAIDNSTNAALLAIRILAQCLGPRGEKILGQISTAKIAAKKKVKIANQNLTQKTKR